MISFLLHKSWHIGRVVTGINWHGPSTQLLARPHGTHVSMGPPTLVRALARAEGAGEAMHSFSGVGKQGGPKAGEGVREEETRKGRYTNEQAEGEATGGPAQEGFWR